MHLRSAASPLACVLRRRAFHGTRAAYKVSTSQLLRNGHGVTFPWRFEDTPERLSPEDAIFHGEPRDVWSLWVQQPVVRRISRFIGEQAIVNNLGMDYFPDKFLQGVYLAAKPALESLSFSPADPDAWDGEHISDFYTPALHARMAREYAKLKEKGDIGIEIAVPRVYDAYVLDTWLNFGPKQAKGQFLTYPPPQGLKFGTVFFALPPPSARPKNPDATSMDMAKSVFFSKDMGLQVHIDVVVTADIAVTVYEHAPEPAPTTETAVAETAVRGTPIVHETSERRDVVLRFSSPYFSPADSISRSGPGGPDDRVWNWAWRVADVDYLLTSEYLKSIEE
ncbi:hypothetical protein H9P43_002217 [Blastocladiella emersonii ATCC 22665]|nr:hypothetical protein H9P43_002217 [Blastocladiella emersonii ATCC 22665]